MTDVLIADYAIRQLHGRFIDATWRQDADAFADCFAKDAEWKIGGMHICGRDEIGSTFAKLISNSERALISVGMPVLEINQGTAKGRVYVTEYAKLPDGTAARTIGIYYDHYVGDGYDWRFQSRHWNLAYRGAPDFSEPFLECMDYGPPPAMPEA